MSEAAEPLRLLIHEASGTQQHMLRQMLADTDHILDFADNGPDVLARVNAGGVDILLTSAEHDDMSGFEICWSVKSEEATRHVYLVLVTSTSDRSRYIEALDSGADDFLRKPYDAGELRARLRAAARIVRLHGELSRQAQTDPLTGACNRRAFTQQLDREIARTVRYGGYFSLVMIDIDHFKSINDTYGHGCGDEVLCVIVRGIQDVLRDSDMLGRIGGEEFAVLLPSTDALSARPLAERLRERIGALRVATDQGPLSFTASLGLASGTGGAETIDRLFARADAALYASKATGRNRVTVAAAV
mgnify:CR=1 FL=1